MLNVCDYIDNSRFFKTFKVDDLLFVEYKCMFHDACVPYWTHNNYFTYILSGNSRYVSGSREYNVKKGDALFIRRGTYMAHGRGNGDYCALLIFVPDEFIRSVLDKYPLLKTKTGLSDHSIFPLGVDESLTAYFHSVLSYFSKDVAPPRELLKIKFEELLVSLLSSGNNPALSFCFSSIHECQKVSLRDVMESSFMYNMGLEEYARLCARSLSVFKNEFYETFGTTPGKWLVQARTQYARVLLETTEESVNDVAFKSGFKNTSHFVRVFKETYGIPPLQYRLRMARHVEKAAVPETQEA